MATILPFPALRFDPAKVRLEDVLTQPYDKITPEMQAKYYSASPYNLVRVELGKTNPDDNENNNVYTRATDFLKKLREEHILMQEKSPCMFAYTQNFEVPGHNGERMERRGFIAVGKLHDYSEKIVYRHEQTLTGPKADRWKLLCATKTHTGQIFMVYPDPQKEVDKIVWSAVGTSTPDAQMTDEYGVQHKIWRIADNSVILQVRDKMQDKKLIIADGHHRYETALKYRNEKRSEDTAHIASRGRTGQVTLDQSQPYENLMMTFVNMHSEGLLVLPTHRLVHSLPGFETAKMFARAQRYFNIEKLPSPDADACMKAVRKNGESGSTLGVVTRDGAWLLRPLEDELDSHLLLKAYSPAQRKLDVLRLHKVLLEDVLDISEQAITDGKHILYFRNHLDAAERVNSGKDGAQAVFLMNPVTMDQMQDVAFAGDVMPQKSTDFYPKMMSGITLQSVE